MLLYLADVDGELNMALMKATWAAVEMHIKREVTIEVWLTRAKVSSINVLSLASVLRLFSWKFPILVTASLKVPIFANRSVTVTSRLKHNSHSMLQRL